MLGLLGTGSGLLPCSIFSPSPILLFMEVEGYSDETLVD